MSTRKQFTSCDACRKSRIGCDAARNNGSCSNCTRRNIICSTKVSLSISNFSQAYVLYKWIAVSKRERKKLRLSKQHHGQEPSRPNDCTTPCAIANDTTSSHPPSFTEAGIISVTSIIDETVGSRRQEALDLHHMLWDIFTTIFEPQLGLWIGNHCNPMKTLDTAPMTLVSRLMVTLDKMSPPNCPDFVPKISAFPTMLAVDEDAMDENDVIINQALISAVHAFSSRWAFSDRLAKEGILESVSQHQFRDILWRRAYAAVSKVLTRPSYRSVLALYLFGTTPASKSVTDRRLADHCFETALLQYVQLRAAASSRRRQHAVQDRALQEQNHLEDAAYWFGIVIDGSRALTRCQPSILRPKSPIWDRVRIQTESFGNAAEGWSSSDVLTEQLVLTAVQYGAASKTLVWHCVACIQEHLIFDPDDSSLRQLLRHAVIELDRFDRVFGPCFGQCTRDWILLSDKARLSFFLLAFHFHLGALILVDIIAKEKNMSVADSDFDINSRRLTSTRAVVNLISLMTMQADAVDIAAQGSAPLILKDPYPEHTRNGLSRSAESVLLMVRDKLITTEVGSAMMAPLFAALDALTQVSYTAEESLLGLKLECAKVSITVSYRKAGWSRRSDTIKTASISQDLFQEETIRQLDLARHDPQLVVKSIERHEVQDISYDFDWNDLEGPELFPVMQDWVFEDCFING
jgi:hypothetical protein